MNISILRFVVLLGKFYPLQDHGPTQVEIKQTQLVETRATKMRTPDFHVNFYQMTP